MGETALGIDSIFCTALEIASSDERAAYLARACAGDTELQRRVEGLLQAHFKAGSFLQDAPPLGLGVTVDMPQIAEGSGTVIGPYRLLEQIGEGGFGIVFMAEQHSPVRRKVALKIIKPGMDSRQVIVRFEAERQALALMDHPNIAKVFDAGTTDTGRPYFVMELVRGILITDFCDQHQLTVSERLELFVDVCQAAQHAHQKGIIHRDIKPSNVLVTLHDDRPVVKVIDFGVAKATSGQLTDQTLFTGFMQMMGTPLYMSPEQTALSGVDIDTRSDIYSLGVLLYELLTGTTPFDRHRLNQAALDEVGRIIREEEPRKPSTRLSTIADTLPSVCARRKIEPRKLTQLLSGDLDWIVMKALEKERTRRYETANGFARDIQRYLADELVEARPPSAGYRLRKAIRRNKVALTTATVVALALIAGTSVSIWQAMLAREAKESAVEQKLAAEAAREDAELARKAEADQRLQAEANLRKAREAVEKYYTTVSESKLLNVPGMLPLRKELLRSALEYYQEFNLALTDHPAALADLAVAELRVVQIMYWNGDQGDRWFPHMQNGIEILEQLVREGHDTPEVQRRVAGYLQSNPEPQYWEGGRNIDRRLTHDILLRAVKLWEKFAHDNPEVSGFQSDLASLNVFIAIDRAKVNQTNEAVLHAERARALWEKLVHKHPEQPRYRLELARLYDEMAMVSSADTAKQLAEKARELFEQLAAEFPGVPLYRTLLGSCYMKAGEAAESPDAAEQAYARAVDQFEKVAAEFPAVVSCRQDLAKASLKLADAMTRRRNIAEAITRYRQSIALFDALAADSPNFARVSTDLATSLYKLSKLLKTIGQHHEADETYQRARATLPKDADRLNNFAWRVVAKPIEQEMDAALAVEVAQKAVDLAPTAGPYWNTLGVAHYRAKDWKSAIAALEKSMELRSGGDSNDWFFMAMARWQLGEKEAARTWYKAAWLWTAVHQPQSVELPRFRAEAAALMGLRETEVPAKIDRNGLVEPLNAALLAIRQIHWDRELASLSRAIEEHPGSPNAWRARADWLVNHGRFAEADVDYSRLLELHSRDHWPWYLRGCLLAYLGHDEQYRANRLAILARFANAEDYSELERTSKSAFLRPLESGANIDLLALRADRILKIAPDSSWSKLVVGLTELRAGRYLEAIGWFEQCSAAPADGYPAQVIAAQAFAAVARHQLGQIKDARAMLERATIQATNELPTLASGDLSRGGVDNWLIAQVALREADATILGRSLPAPPQTTGPAVPARPPRPTAPTAFRGQTAIVPGVIQAENFDEGGEGIAYLDTTSQNLGVGDRYRMESVDIDECTDAGKGYNVGGILAGEWLAYTIDVKESGPYDLDLRLCSPSGGRLHVKFGGNNATVPVEVPATGWGHWTTMTVKNVPVNAGIQLMRVNFDAGGTNIHVCNFNWIELRRSMAAAPSPNTTNEIQAKNGSFDKVN